MKSILLVLIMSLSALTATAADKPNVLFIFGDEWGWGDFNCISLY